MGKGGETHAMLRLPEILEGSVVVVVGSGPVVEACPAAAAECVAAVPAPEVRVNRLSGWRDALAAGPKRRAEGEGAAAGRTVRPRLPTPLPPALARDQALREAVILPPRLHAQAAAPAGVKEEEEQAPGFTRSSLIPVAVTTGAIPVTPPSADGQPVDDTLWGLPPVPKVEAVVKEEPAAVAAVLADGQAAEVLPTDMCGDGSELDVPHGALTVPLLRHQRRALAWMHARESSGGPCGGLLADDQGLGKTLSTISLIVAARPPPRAPTRSSALVPGAAVPGGTLVVCPTSVLRQWARELSSRVSGAAALSVLLYHGPGRSRSAGEVARYDVVLTTYAIVSQELSPASASSGDGGAASASGSTGVLAAITWWRVVLDEAQSIKNSRSLVAASVWALLARRRWCLSGTPLQNSVDDLYSYFRFLHYAPYDDVGCFRAQIREPIRAAPAAGFAQLQRVLAAVMLRRTKATKIAGEPIVRLPPRSVRLRAVEFSSAERECYARLQAEYRLKFAEFRAAGTVSNNYVNILYMLLRLRQACNHLALNSASSTATREQAQRPPTTSEVSAAKRLPADARAQLLAVAEAGQGECPLCNDCPEDAVVAACGTLFCRQCWSTHLAGCGGDEERDPCPSCGAAHGASDAYTAPALRVASGAKAHASVASMRASAAAAADSDGCGGLAASCKLRAVLDYLNDLRTRMGGSRPPPRRAAAAASPSARGKGKRDKAKEQRERGELLRDGIRSSDAALAAALPPLPPVAFGAPRMGSGAHGLAEPPEKVIIFSQWTGMLNLLEPALKADGFQFRRLDGTMSLAARERALMEFESHPEVNVMLMSLKAAGLGVNLVCANHVLLLDVWWNPTVEEQAIDRSHRIGQRREVFVSRLTVADTVEDRILALQEHKRALATAAFGEGGASERERAAEQAGDAAKNLRLSVEDLLFLFEAAPAPPAPPPALMAA